MLGAMISFLCLRETFDPGFFKGKGGAVHPRVCGERPFYFLFQQRNNGSSPRLRGTLSGPPKFNTQLISIIHNIP
jgi:hypothetical protein